MYAATPSADPSEPSSTFSIDHKVQVPGETLKPGEYSIHIMNKLSDRVIVTIDGQSDKQHTVFLGVPTSPQNMTAAPGAVDMWTSGPNNTPAARGYSFPSGQVIEFVYPKAEAAALAKLNGAKVVAVDPQSEGMRPLPHLSKDDMQVVNLWTLSMTTVGTPKQRIPAVQAEHYEAGAEATQVAAAPPAPQVVPAQTNVATLEQPRDLAPVQSTDTPHTRHEPPVSELPHTATNLPLIGLISMLSLFAAAILEAGRRRTFLNDRV